MSKTQTPANPNSKPLRRTARISKDGPTTATQRAAKLPSRLDQLEQLLSAPGGASIAEMVEATSWQQHSVRGSMAGALKKKRGLLITSDKIDGVRRYHAQRPA